MKTRIKFLFLISMWGLLAAGNLMANTLTLTGLPAGDTDTLSLSNSILQTAPLIVVPVCIHRADKPACSIVPANESNRCLGAGVSARSMNPCSAAVKQQYFAQ